ncbi:MULTISPECIES: cytochrome c [unclassified Beijerinckia]|uniref:c-type cytochrome n=1 Tax=unclassified Beijerinckia TaxID=2638183 RepID=UPI00244ED00B|nr:MULTISPECIES: cytochrome c [unclassified Beijerinckia]
MTSTHAAPNSSVRRGQQMAKANCAICHSIDKRSESTDKEAPPFRELKNRYPLDSLEEAFAEGLSTSHPRMPIFKIENPQGISDFINFLKSL